MALLLLLPVVIGLLVMCVVKHLVSRPKNLPPGPSLLALFKGFWELFRGQNDQITLLSSWAEKYGEMMSFYVGSRLVIVLSSYKVIAEAFRRPDLQDRPSMRLMREVHGKTTATNVTMASGEIWKEQRKFIFSVFRSLGVGKTSFGDIITEEMEKLISAIEQRNGVPFDPAFLISRAVANTICSIVFGTKYQYDDKEFQQLLEKQNLSAKLFGGGGSLLFLNIPGIFKIPFGKPHTLSKTLRNLHKFYKYQIESHEKSLEPHSPKDFIDQYLNKIYDVKDKNSSFTKPTLAHTIGDIFTAGTDTTASTLTWCILYMMAYPEIQLRVQEELDHVIGRDRLPRLDDRKELHYTNAVLMEVQRKAAVVPLGGPHVAAANVRLHGYDIPKGATLVPNIWKVLNGEEYWKDAGIFTPERFLGKDGKLINRNDLIFFSTGHRICVGEQLARMETFLGFTSLLHRFCFRTPDYFQNICFEGVLGLMRSSVPFMTCALLRK